MQSIKPHKIQQQRTGIAMVETLPRENPSCPLNETRRTRLVHVISAEKMEQQQGMVCAMPATADTPVPPRRGLHLRRHIAEGKQGHVFQGHGDKGEGPATDVPTDTSVSANSEDPCQCSYHLYHRLVTYPLEEIRLPAAQVMPPTCANVVGACYCMKLLWDENLDVQPDHIPAIQQAVVRVQRKRNNG